MKVVAASIFVAFMSAGAVGQQWPFSEYPVAVFRGRPATSRLETPLAREHRTIIRESVEKGPNFAGHYTVVLWGCGTMCGVFVIVDDLSGKVYEPPELARGVSLAMGGPEFRIDSALMVLADCPPRYDGSENCERKFYEWNGNGLVLLKSEPMTGESTR